MMPLLDLCEPEELDVNADDGFERFLEALACDDTCTTIPVYPDTVPRFNAQHEASQPAKKSLNKCIGVRFVPADQETEKMPDHATVNHVSALQDLSALPTAQEVKLEKLREKNRRTQKAFRVRQKERCEELKSAVQSATQNLEASRARWRQLRLHRSALQQRLKAALEDTSSHCLSTANIQESAQSTARDLAEVAGSRHSAHRHLQTHSAEIVVRAASYSGASTPERPLVNAPRPISSFARCEGISFAAISAFMAPGEAPTQAFKYNALTQAVAAYQQRISTRTGIPVADICWLQEWNFPGVEPSLSFSASASSPECSLGGALCFIVGSLESMFLVLEHEMLLEASDPTYEPPQHPGLHASDSRAPPPPTPPNPRVLKDACVRCGVHEMLPVKVALKRAVKAVLIKYGAILPQQRWRSVCLQTIHLTQAIIDALGGPTEGSVYDSGDRASTEEMHESHEVQSREGVHEEVRQTSQRAASVTVESTGQGMRWEGLTAAMVATQQELLSILHSAIQKPPQKGLQTAEVEGRSVQEVEQRMFELVGSAHMCTILFLQASRQSMILYKQLQLQPDQRACMADRWKSWCRRRAALGHQLAATLARFEEACPQPTDVRDLLMLCNTLVATSTRPDEPVDTDQRVSPGTTATVDIHTASHATNASEQGEGNEAFRSPAAPRTGVSSGTRTQSMRKHESMRANSTEPACMRTESRDCPSPRTSAVQDAESCMSLCAAAVQELHWLMPDNQNDSSFSAGVQNHIIMNNSAHVHADNACIMFSTGDSNRSTEAYMHEHASVRLWSKCISRYSPDSNATCKLDSFGQAGPEIPNSTGLERLNACTATGAFYEAGGNALTMHTEQQRMHAVHDCTSSLVTTVATNDMPVMRGSCASGAQSAAHACQQSSTDCSSSVEAPCTAGARMHEGGNAWNRCMICCKANRIRFLGEGVGGLTEVYDALRSFQDVHTSDALMHFEVLGPFVELTEKQQALLLAASIDLAQPKADMTTLWRAAAEEEKREALFGHLSTLFL